MKILHQLKRKMILKQYGRFATIILSLISPFDASVSTLKIWHFRLMKLKYFSDFCAKLFFYTLILAGILYFSVTYALVFMSIDEFMPVDEILTVITIYISNLQG